jgi:hypothetical protein
MRRRWPVVAMAAGFALVGCADERSGTPAPAPAVSVPATARAGDAPRTTPATAGTGSFVELVRAKLPEIATDRRDEEIQAIADTACAELGAGKEPDAIVAGTRSLGTLDAEATDQATARELIKLAIDTTCPDQSGRVDDF